MRKTSWVIGQVLAVVEWGLILGLCIPMLALDARAESLNVKPGAWEMTVTTVASGMKLSPEMAANMTPAQRIQMEQMMKARDGKPHTMTIPSCLTKEDVAHDRIIKEMEDEDDEAEVNCKVKVISKSSSKLVIDQICPGPPASTGHLTIEAKTPESLVATGDRNLKGSGKAHLDIKGKWLRASCEGVED
ncbi:MAG: DUF3617 domain-containing protein [Nitrospira sp.]|jgi:hypothetical protein|nr:MAG: DUF3617 domain-containing protein [Nitrospira sp.]